MGQPNLETDIECPHCGAMAPAEVLRCPNCGQPFYPEDEEEARPLKRRAVASAGLPRRVLTGLVLGGLLGGSLSLVVGPAWVWLVLVGALLLGGLGWLWERWGE